MKPLTNAFFLACAYLKERVLATGLNVLLLSLGVATLIALLLTLHHAEERLNRDNASIDLVVGAKGSPLQLVLSAVFHIDVPTGNVPQKDAAALLNNPLVRSAIPLALGDSYRRYRIVGTEHAYAGLYAAKLARGRFWDDALEVVIGAQVARDGDLDIGKRFTSSHGLTSTGGAHDAHHFVVVGVLAETGSVIDRLILTSLESVWHVHADHDEGEEEAAPEVTAYLVKYASPIAAASFPRMVNGSSALQAASPALETARLFALLGVGIKAFKLFAVIMMLAAALGIFIGLMAALEAQREDLALLRVLGASPGTVCLTVIVQGFLLGLMGVILGLVLGHLGAHLIGVALAKAQQLPVAGFTLLASEAWVVLGALALGVLAAVFPAWRAYHLSAPEALRRD